MVAGLVFALSRQHYAAAERCSSAVACGTGTTLHPGTDLIYRRRSYKRCSKQIIVVRTLDIRFHSGYAWRTFFQCGWRTQLRTIFLNLHVVRRVNTAPFSRKGPSC